MDFYTNRQFRYWHSTVEKVRIDTSSCTAAIQHEQFELVVSCRYLVFFSPKSVVDVVVSGHMTFY